MSKLVKTGMEITNEIITDQDIDGGFCIGQGRAKNKYIVLPEGLDTLEEMLKKRCTEMEGTIAQNQVSDIFTRFKRENEI